jgi:hypothetical protein
VERFSSESARVQLGVFVAMQPRRSCVRPALDRAVVSGEALSLICSCAAWLGQRLKKIEDDDEDDWEAREGLILFSGLTLALERPPGHKAT